jgi:signal transduction histidine kinase
MDPLQNDTVAPAPLALSKRRAGALILLAVTVVALLTFAYKYLDRAAYGRSPNPLPPLIEELTGHYAGLLLLAPLVLFAGRIQLAARPWRYRIAFHAAGVLLYSALHTTLNWGSRTVLFPLSGLGAYDYGILPVRYAMEFPKDLTSYVIIFGFAALFEHYRAARAREFRTVQLEAQLARAQLQNLQAQLHPHFLFNTLNTISSVMYEDVRAADRMLARLSDLLRRALHASQAQQVALAEELELLGSYLDLMRARFGERLSVQLMVDDEVRAARVPALLLQPLLENALEHGAPPAPEPARVVLRGRREGDRLLLEVEDNGPGLPHPDAPLLGRGIGLTNTAERLSGLYGAAGVLEWREAANGGLIVSVRLPYTPTQAQKEERCTVSAS